MSNYWCLLLDPSYPYLLVVPSVDESVRRRSLRLTSEPHHAAGADVDDVRRLHGLVRRRRVEDVDVTDAAVDRQWLAAVEVGVLLPERRHVVIAPPRVDLRVALEPRALLLEEAIGEFANAIEFVLRRAMSLEGAPTFGGIFGVYRISTIFGL